MLLERMEVCPQDFLDEDHTKMTQPRFGHIYRGLEGILNGREPPGWTTHLTMEEKAALLLRYQHAQPVHHRQKILPHLPLLRIPAHRTLLRRSQQIGRMQRQHQGNALKRLPLPTLSRDRHLAP